MKRPPTTINGDTAIHIRASLHSYLKQIATDTANPKKASSIIAIDSVVKPFKLLISSYIILVRTPVVLFLLSNHPMCL